MEENTNFHCIVCKAEFLSRSDRNEHLETHFVHRSCKHCSRPVIIIGDLEFELHHPTYCKPQIDIKHEEKLEQSDESMNEEILPTNPSPEIKDECLDTKGLGYFEIKATHRSNRAKCDVNYTEENDDEDDDDDESEPIMKKEKPVRKSKRKSTRSSTEAARSYVGNNYDSNDEFAESTYLSRKADLNSDDDVIKEMDVAMKKRRKQYAKLPKTVPCTLCDGMFGTERTLKIHMHQVHGIKERYICPICSREFKIGGNLKQHIETHSDYKRFICNYCGKGFHLPYNLKEHMNTHTGAR